MAQRSGLAPVASIREFADGDTAAIIALARQLQAHELQFFDRLLPAAAIGEAYVATLRADVAKARGVILVAEYDGRVAGYATLQLHESSEGERDEQFYTYSHIGDLAVAEELRGRGIGRLLIAECERRARAAGQKWLRLGVLGGNAPARRFYRDLGFDELGLWLEKSLG
jgi:ribosomal protein S18 acetylase RimI-like enzyme